MPDPGFSLLQLNRDWHRALVDLERQGQPHPWSAAQLADALSEADLCIWGALNDDKRLIGFAALARLPFDAELQAITVAPAWRRRGVGKALLEGLVAQANVWRSERLLLEVRAGNDGAIALYRQLGFNEDGRRRGYYRGGQAGMGNREDAILMSRPLAPASNDGLIQ